MGYRNHTEDIRSFLDSRHADHYTVFNLSQRNYRGAKFSNRVSAISHISRLTYFNFTFQITLQIKVPVGKVLRACVQIKVLGKISILSLLPVSHDDLLKFVENYGV